MEEVLELQKHVQQEAEKRENVELQYQEVGVLYLEKNGQQWFAPGRGGM